MKTAFASFSFGCRVNEAERQMLEQQMLAAGFSLNPAAPALCLINTCAVTAKAEREARQLIYQLLRKYPKAKIIVTGCAAVYWRKNGLPALSSRVSVSESRDLLPLILKRNRGIPRLQHSPLGMTDNSLMTKSGRALVKIQDGCQRFCSYCIVPYLRGQPKSERISSIVNNVRALHDRTQEVILTAINTEAFGYDTGENFVDLVKQVIDETTIPRISFGSIHPWSVSDEFFRFYREYLPKNRLVNFFHIPLQSGSNKILTLMKRGYTREELLEKLNKLHKINPLALIATDIIVGFLDETDKDFAETYDFLKNSPISRFHVFRFSKRENTAAYFMAKRLAEPPPAVKTRRARRLTRLSKRKFEDFLAKLVDYRSAALFIDKKEGDCQQVLLDNQAPAWIKTDKNLNGEIKNVRITGFKNGKLFGKID